MIKLIKTAGYDGTQGEVEIKGTVYTLTCHGKTSKDGYRLENQDNGKVYDIDTSSGYPVCDCPDYIVRRGKVKGDYCKHGKCLVQLRKERKL